jgi:hypothetical protein
MLAFTFRTRRPVDWSSPGQFDHVARQPPVEEPHYRIRDLGGLPCSPRIGPGHPGQLDGDRRRVDAFLPGQLVRVQCGNDLAVLTSARTSAEY